MKNILILFLILYIPQVWAEGEFIGSFDIDLGPYNTLADRVTSFYTGDVIISAENKHKELTNSLNSIQLFIKQQPNNPVLYFLKGLNLSLLSGIYASDKDKKKLNQFIEKTISAYKEAMILDKNHTPHLTPSTYATMKHSLPENLKIEAIQKELSLGGNGTNESYYWFLHSSNINALQQAGRFEDAKKALNTMKRELNDSSLNNSKYAPIATRASNEIKKQSKETSPPDTKSPAKESDKTKFKVSSIISNLVIFSILSLLIAAFYEFVLKKKNK
jgi:hypothetical protein